MTTVITKQYMPNGTSVETAYDGKDEHVDGSLKVSIPKSEDARTYPARHEKPQPNIFERTNFKWIPGVA